MTLGPGTPRGGSLPAGLIAAAHGEHYPGLREEPWFALRVRSNFERAVAAGLRGRGFEDYLPLCRCVRHWPSRTRIVELPMFSGYVFGRFDPLDRLPVLTIPGVVKVVGTSEGPLPIDAEELAATRRVADSGLLAEPWPFVRIGQRVRVTGGPLVGLEGIVAAVRNTWRLVISITLLQRSVAVEIDRQRVERVPDRGSGQLLPRAGLARNRT